MSDIKENKRLVEEYPFLLPRNRFTGKVPDDYDFSYTELDEMPKGWRIAFGEQMCQEIKEELEKYNFLYDYRITQIKEKYGSLRWYDNGYPKGSKILDIINKYEKLSETICLICGELATKETSGFIFFVCDDCYKEFIKNEKTNNNG